jgi:fatty acid desaturase
MKHHIKIPEEFTRRNDGLAWAMVLANVLVVLCSGVLAWRIGNWWGYVIAFLLVGARGQACYVLQHEAMHNLLFTRVRTNERVGTILSALLGTRFYMGRKIHWDHHRRVGNADDPNEMFHNVEDRPPGMAVIRFFGFHLLGGRLILLIRNLCLTAARIVFPAKGSDGAAKADIPFAKTRIDLMALFVTQLAVFIVMSLLSSPLIYFTLYMLPLATLTAFFEAIRSFSEHVLPGEATCEAEASRRFFMDASPVESFFVSQFDFHYHHVHHLHPNVVTFKVRALHRWLNENDPDYPGRFISRPGYVEVALRYLFSRPFAGAGSGYPVARVATVGHVAG